MNLSILPRFFSGLFVVFILSSGAIASPSTDDEGDAEAQVVSGISLPHWAEGECQENFDMSIWPGAVKIWLEQENLRSLISDPETPEPERQSLKRILAMQRAWRVGA